MYNVGVLTHKLNVPGTYQIQRTYPQLSATQINSFIGTRIHLRNLGVSPSVINQTNDTYLSLLEANNIRGADEFLSNFRNYSDWVDRTVMDHIVEADNAMAISRGLPENQTLHIGFDGNVGGSGLDFVIFDTRTNQVQSLSEFKTTTIRPDYENGFSGVGSQLLPADYLKRIEGLTSTQGQLFDKFDNVETFLSRNGEINGQSFTIADEVNRSLRINIRDLNEVSNIQPLDLVGGRLARNRGFGMNLSRMDPSTGNFTNQRLDFIYNEGVTHEAAQYFIQKYYDLMQNPLDATPRVISDMMEKSEILFRNTPRLFPDNNIVPLLPITPRRNIFSRLASSINPTNHYYLYRPDGTPIVDRIEFVSETDELASIVYRGGRWQVESP